MRLGIVPDAIGERIALGMGVVPTPVLHTLVGLTLARAIMVATKLGIFEIVEQRPAAPEEIARASNADVGATRKLLSALVTSDLLQERRGQYALSRTARRWLVESSATSLRDTTLSFLLESHRLDHLESFVKSGRAVDFHRTRNDPEAWNLYQRGMRGLAVLSAGEIGRRTWIPPGAREMLDIGGSHGLFSAAICRRRPGLRSVILDLPEAIEFAEPLLAAEKLGDRVSYRAGDARVTDLGVERYDVVFMSQLAHHFTDAENRALARRVHRALRPGGVFVIQELMRGGSRRLRGDQIGGLMDLWFALTSESGTWSFDEIAAWQRDAGLHPRRPVVLRTLPSGGQQGAIKKR
jgi:SAM-dependent methyltransferase